MRTLLRRFAAIAGTLVLATSAPFVAQAAPNLVNAAAASYDPGNGTLVQVLSPSVLTAPNPVLSISSAVTACQGGALPDYTGWTVGVYNSDGSGNPTTILPLTRTQLPFLPTVNLPAGIAPNNQNANPFSLTNGNKGLYEFLLDATAGQTTAGRSFTIVTGAPRAAAQPNRRIRIVLGATVGTNVNFTATSLDTMPVNADSPSLSVTGTFPIVRTSATGNFAVLQLAINECPTNTLSITKTANVPSAEVGDTVVYSVTVTNTGLSPVTNPTVTDILPLGFSYVPNSVRAGVGTAQIPVAATMTGSRLTMTTAVALPPAGIVSYIYATVITPDALRGSAQNVAVVDGSIGTIPVHGGPAAYTLRLNPGILSDCGTIIGRVYIDNELLGMQRRDQKGFANAVVFFDDGVRVKTDSKGLYHYPGCAHPGWRTAVLDLKSVPGFTLAPNIYVLSKNGQSQSAHLEPSGMVRINFAIVPAATEKSR